MSSSPDAGSLPPIPKAKQSLVEASRRSTRSMPCFEDSGLDMRDSTSTASFGRSGGSKAPPNLLVKAAAVPMSPRPQSPLRRSLEYVRLSRGELDRKEQNINSLRTENVQLQARLREMENCKDNHSTLQSACCRLGQMLGCTVEGVAAESVGDILQSKLIKLTQEHQQALQQAGRFRSELDTSKGELAAAEVKMTTLQSQVEQTRSALTVKEAQLLQLTSELEALHQSSARTTSTLQSLRQQLAEVEEGKQSSHTTITDLQMEVGRLKNEMKEKDNHVKNLESELAAKQDEQDCMEERATNLDAVYTDLCFQLASALQLESTNDLFDADTLLPQVNSLMQECNDSRLRIDTMTKTIKTAELDSKASRETILRLVSEVKKHEKTLTQVTELQQAHEQLSASLSAVEKERDSLQERLLAAKETLSAQEQEIQAKGMRVSELSSSLQSLRLASETEQDTVESIQLKFEEFCRGIATLVGAESTADSVTLLQSVEQLTQAVLDERRGSVGQVQQLELERSALQHHLGDAQEDLKQERTKVTQLEGELVTVDVVKEGMYRELEKHKSFYKKLAKTLRLDTATAEILSGDFAEEAILVRADQLAKQETQTLAERQSAMYSLQRKLKASRQNLESKELHLGLLQKKLASLEERLQTYNHREADWETDVDKARKLEKQLERLQSRMVQQRDTISQLKTENQEVHKLKTHCSEQEGKLARLAVSVDELTQIKVQQAQQLAEVRQRVRSAGAKERSGVERLQAELRTTQCDLERTKEREKQLSVFRSTMQQLLAGEEESETTLSDYDIVAKLESTLALQRQYKETARCLEASLKQLELGFKTGYNDTLTLLNSNP